METLEELVRVFSYIEGKDITQAGRKKSQLLHLAGTEVQDLYEDLYLSVNR